MICPSTTLADLDVSGAERRQDTMSDSIVTKAILFSQLSTVPHTDILDCSEFHEASLGHHRQQLLLRLLAVHLRLSTTRFLSSDWSSSSIGFLSLILDDLLFLLPCGRDLSGIVHFGISGPGERVVGKGPACVGWRASQRSTFFWNSKRLE